MRQRLISAAVLVPVVVIILFAGHPWTAIGIGVIAALAGWEIAQLVRTAGLPANRWLVVAAPLILIAGFEYTHDLLFFGYGSPEIEVALIAGWIIVAALDGMRQLDPRQGFLAWSGTLLGSLYAALFAFTVAVSNYHQGDSSGRGGFWLLVLVVTVWSLDSAAYVVGRYFPRGRFMNHISPNKTWSGAIAGALAAIIVCVVLVVMVGDESLGAGLALGIVIAITAQAGDLAESMVKRAAAAKDSGTMIPGHGGFLDRVDSFMFAAPAMYLTFLLLFYAKLGVQ